MKSDNIPKFTIVILALVGFGSLSWLGLNLMTQNTQIQQFQKANNLLAQKKYTEAIAIYDELLEIEVGQKHLVWINRGYALAGLDRYQQMWKSCNNATTIDSQFALGWNCQAEALYYQQKYPAALKALEKAIAINPTEIIFLLNKSRVLDDLQQYQKVIATSKKAIELGEQSSSLSILDQQNLGLAYQQQGRALLQTKAYQSAIKAFNRALEYAPDNLNAQQGLGVAFYELAQHEKSIKVFEQILKREDLTLEQQALSWLYKGINLCQNKQGTIVQNRFAAKQAFQKVLQLTKEAEVITMAQAGCGIR